jgi:protein phosphatase
LAGSCVAVSTPAYSDASVRLDGGGDVSEARTHFSRGLALYNASKFEEARAELEQAYALAPNYRLLYNLALASDGQGDRASAIRYLMQYLAEGGAQIDPARRKEADDLLARLRSRVALVTIHTNVTGDAGVTVDEQPYGEVSTTPLVLLPGARKIWVTKAGYYPASQTVLAKEGEGVDVSFELKELPRAPAVAPPPWWRDRRALAALGVAMLATIAVLVTLSRKRRAATSSLVQLNPYQGEGDATAEPTEQQTNVIVVDDAGGAVAGRIAVRAAVATDVGKVKPANQDSHLVDAERGIFVVADGIGGFAGGEVASAVAVATVANYFRGKPAIGLLKHVPAAAAELANAVFSANAAIRRRASAEVNIADMGSTCVAARFCLETAELFVVHVGDSRVYRLRGGVLTQLTTDHTMAELGVTGRRAQHLSRALGTEAAPRVDILLARALPNDTYLLCCDGLTKMVDDASLKKIIEAASTPELAVEQLVVTANANGGLDNITALVVRVALRS